MAGKAFALRRQEGPADRAGLVAALGQRIARIEERAAALGGEPGAARPLALGLDEVDAALGGVPAEALHEVRCEATADAACAAGFALALAARAAGGVGGGLVWIAPRLAGQEAGLPFGPGVAAFGLDPSALLRVETDRIQDALWAAGEVAATKGAGVCLLELRGNPAAADLAFTRRLALRARDHGVPVVLLRQAGAEEASAAATRWGIAPAPSRAGQRKWVGPPAFAARLEKCRGGRTGEWTLEWNNDERLFALAEGAVRGAVRPGARPPLSLRQPAEAFDRPDPARPSRSGLALRSA